MTSAKMVWKSGFQFEGVSKFGAPIVTDEGVESGGTGEGYSPVELVLFGLIGCTGIDTIMILEKMRQKVTSLEIQADAERPDDYPRLFTKVTLTYKYTGENLDPERVKQAVKLSQEKYCTVSQTLINEVPLDQVVSVDGNIITMD